MPIFNDVRQLACYVQDSYMQLADRADVSTVKLHKTLYFMFAWWGAYIKTAQTTKYKIEYSYAYYSPYLFSSPFQAWIYGPALPEVYAVQHELYRFRTPSLCTDIFVQQYVDDWIKQLFATSDFMLVEVAQKDKVWKTYYSDELQADIPADEIIAEYIPKVLAV